MRSYRNNSKNFVVKYGKTKYGKSNTLLILPISITCVILPLAFVFNSED